MTQVTNQLSPVEVGRPAKTRQAPPAWTFLTNHAHVLIAIARSPESTLREVAVEIGITERSTQKIVADLDVAGYLTRERHGRRNRYTIPAGRPFRHPIAAGHDVDALLNLLVPQKPLDSTHDA